MKVSGSVGGINQKIVKTIKRDGVPSYAFDIFFDSNADGIDEFRFLWKLVITYEISTTPDQDPHGPLPCSGWIGDPPKMVFPCECCFYDVPSVGTMVPPLGHGYNGAYTDFDGATNRKPDFWQ